MSLKIRLARAGTKKRPVYHIVIADSRSPRDGRFIERLGYFNPLLPKEKTERLKLDLDKVKAWLAKGALPTDRVLRFLDEAGVDEAREAQQPHARAPAQGAQGPRRGGREGGGCRQGSGSCCGQGCRAGAVKPRVRRTAAVSERICVAQIGGPHGIRGEVKLKSFTADPMAVKRLRAAGERGRLGALCAGDGAARQRASDRAAARGG